MFTPPNELVSTFGSFHAFANFGENYSRNATVTVCTDLQTGFVISPMLYAIAMVQIIVTCCYNNKSSK